MSGRRVVVTGMGMVTPLGNSLKATLDSLQRGESAIRPATLFDTTGFAERAAGEVRDFNPRDYFRQPKAIKLTDRAARLAVAAASMALDEARLARDQGVLDELGVVIGSSGSDLQARDLARAIGYDPERRSAWDTAFFAERILSGLNPLWLLVNLPNMTSAHVAIQLEARGPNSTIMTDWIAGAQAIGEAFDWIRNGEVDAVLAGGADCGVYPFAYASYDQGGLFNNGPDPAEAPLGTNAPSTASCAGLWPAALRSEDYCRFVPGEGAAVFFLEERERALQRRALIHGELRGYACAAAPIARDDRTANALARTMQEAVDESGWRAGEVQAIATASVFSSPFFAAEQAAVRSVCGPRAGLIPQIQVKSRMGHALAASGAIDFGLLLALHAGRGTQGGLLCNSLGYSGQAATLAVAPEDGT